MATGQFEFFQLRCFVAVAEELNFRRAAERMNMTQPPLSRQIKILEHGLGVTLFDRTNRQVQLTPAGASFLAHAAEILQRAEHAVLSARQSERGEAGAIAMGFVPSAALEFVPRIVVSLQRDLPDVTFNPTEMMSYEIVEGLISGQLDFGLARSSGRHSELQSQRVVIEPFVLAVPRNHALARAERPALADLDGENYVAYSTDRGGFIREMQVAVLANEGIAPRFVLEVSQTHTVLALVNRGIGVALVPSSAQAMRMDNLVFRSIELPDRLRSELFLISGPKGFSALHRNVRDTMIAELAGYVAIVPD